MWLLTLAPFALLTFVCYRLAKQRDEIARAHEALKNEVAARQRVELELRSAQKLEAVGRLAAGVAHEINTPIQFVGNSLGFVEEGMHDLLFLAEHAAPEGLDDVDVGYLKAHLPIAMSLANEGIRRVSAIVGSMKQFVHPGHQEALPVDLDVAIANTLTISKHEYKLVADVETRFGGLPPVVCNAGEIGQVLLNIIVNAAHTIEDRVGDSTDRGTITVSSRLAGSDAVIEISDTGLGIVPEIRDRIFEPFFTTKEVGRGTGQGLAISKAIVERHGGKLEFDTEVGIGTTFTVRLPLVRSSSPSSNTRQEACSLPVTG